MFSAATEEGRPVDQGAPGCRSVLGRTRSTLRLRRDMTAGQKAMAYAFIYPDPATGGRGKKTVQPLDSFSKQLLSEARIVLKEAPPLAEEGKEKRESLPVFLKNISGQGDPSNLEGSNSERTADGKFARLKVSTREQEEA